MSTTLDPLKIRQDWAYHVVKAGLVKCTQREYTGRGMRWTVPSKTNAKGMEFHEVKRARGNQFRCWLINPLGWGDPCWGNRSGGVCRHVMAVVTDEMLRRERRVRFANTEKDAVRGKRAAFRVWGEGGGEMWVSHRKGG